MIRINKKLCGALLVTSMLIGMVSHYAVAFGADEDNEYASTTTSVSNVVDISVSESESVRIILNNENKAGSVVNTESSVKSNSSSIDVAELLQLSVEVKEERKMKAELARKTYSTTNTQGGLVDIAKPDANYKGTAIKVTGRDREILENLVFGEAGNQGFIGCALVAQAIRDMYILGNFDSIDAVRRNCGYSGSISKGTNQDAKDAVAFIFDQGGYAVKHRVLYFYAPQYSAGKFHNTQNFIIEYKDHRFFDRWK